MTRLSEFKSKKVKNIFRTLRVLCGPTRFRIVLLLNKYKRGLTVTQLARLLDASSSSVSHQLAIFKKHNLVLAKRTNREVIYTLANHRIRKIFTILTT